MQTSRKILLAWLALYVILGVLSGFTGFAEREPRVFSVLTGIATMVLTYMWCRAEASERMDLVPSGYTMFAVLLSPLGIPVYFMRTRKRFGLAAVSTAKAFGFYAGAALMLMIAEAVVLALRA